MISVYDNERPSGWEEEELRKLTLRKRGYSWSKDDEADSADDNTVPVLRIPNIQKQLDLDNLLHLRNVSAQAMSESAITKDWILFVGSNGNPARIGDSALMSEDKRMIFASFLMAIASKEPDRLRPKFLAAWLRLHRVHEAFSRTSQQTTGLANFSWSAVKRLPVRFPKRIEEQNAITNVLDKANELLRTTAEKLDASRRLKTALIRQLFTRGLPGRHSVFKKTKWFESPESWQPTQLRRLADVEAGFTMGRDLTGYETAEVPYLTVVNVLAGSFDLRDLTKVQVKLSELDGLLLRPRDVLMTEGGDRDKLGRGAVWRGQIEPCVYQNHIFRIRFNSSAYDPELFHFLLQTWQARNYFYAHAKQTSNLCTINSRELKRFPFAVPDPDEQEEMKNLLLAADAQIESVEAELQSIHRLKTALLQNLLTGCVRVRI